MNIPFNKPYMTGKELWYISQAHHLDHLSGDEVIMPSFTFVSTANVCFMTGRSR